MLQSISTPENRPLQDARQRVLVVEDEYLIRTLLSDELRDEGYDVIEASNADEALLILETAVPDLIISDVRMPGSIDGLGLLALVSQSHPTLRVIITSGHLQPTLATAAGATQFVPKPYSLEVIVKAAQNRLTKVAA